LKSLDEAKHQFIKPVRLDYVRSKSTPKLEQISDAGILAWFPFFDQIVIE